MVITKWTSKHNRMTMTEEKFYLHLLDFISNGKCGRRTAARTECPWIRLTSVCVERTGWSIPVISATCAEHQDVMTFDEGSIFISIFPVIRSVTARTMWRFIFQSVISFSALMYSVADYILILESREIYQKCLICIQMLCKNYTEVVRLEIFPYVSDCKHHIWLCSFDNRRPEDDFHLFKW